MLHNRISNKELKEKIKFSNEARTTISFYKYHHLQNPKAFRDELYLAWNQLGVMGRIYVADEGINAQLSVPSENFEAFKSHLYSYDFLNGVRLNTAVEDDVLALLGKAGAIKMDMVPTLIFKEAGEFEKMDTEVARHFLQNPKNYSWGVLQEIRDEMIEEFISNQNRLRDLYLNPLETIEGYNGKLNAKDLVSYIEYLKVRLRRSMSYMLPEFTFTKSTNPSTKTQQL